MVTSRSQLSSMIDSSRWNFSLGDVRRALDNVREPEAQYSLFKVAANPTAHEKLQEFYCFRKPRTREQTIYRTADSDEWDEDSQLSFDSPLLAHYEDAVERLSNRLIGSNNYASWPEMKTGPTICGPTRIASRRIYVVNNDHNDDLRDIVEHLVQDHFNELEKIEEPFYYHMAETEVLAEFGVEPFEVVAEIPSIDLADLSTYIDFFSQTSLKRRDNWSFEE